MLNYFKRERMAICVQAVQNFFAKYLQRQQIEENHASKLEAYLSIVYNLLIWDDPFISGVAFSLAHVIFWVVLYFELKIYCILFLFVLVLFVLDASFDNVGAQTNKLVPLKHIREIFKLSSAFLNYMTTLRREHPGTFCVCMCTSFLILSIIGRTVSGLFLTYFGLLTILLAPGIIYRLPPEVLDTLRHALHVISTNEGVVHEHELFPNLNEDEDRDGDCDSIKTDHTADSYTNSFISGVTTMPSYLDAEGSLDGLEEEDLEFTTRNIPMAVTPSSFSTDSSDNEHKDIRFESSHFNRDSSSDEEHNYEQGLTFSELDTTTDDNRSAAAVLFTHQLSVDLLSNLGSMGSSFVSSVFKTASGASSATPATGAPPKLAKRNDSDSDFEIINTDDLHSEET